MPKVTLTQRRRVEALSRWFKIEANETVINVRTEFGTVTLSRVAKGLNIWVQPKVEEAFVQLSNDDGACSALVFDADYSLALRPIGSVSLGEMKELEQPELYRRVSEWLKNQGKKNG